MKKKALLLGLSALALGSCGLGKGILSSSGFGGDQGFSQEEDRPQTETVFSEEAYRKDGAEAPVNTFVYDAYIPAYVGSTINLKEYVYFNSANYDNGFSTYVLDGGSEFPVASQDASKDSLLTFYRADTCYVRLEKGEVVANLEIHVSQSKVGERIASFIESLGGLYQATSAVIQDEVVIRDVSYYYHSMLQGGYLYSESNKSTNYFRLSSLSGDDLEVVLPNYGGEESFHELVGGLEGVTSKSLTVIPQGGITVGGLDFLYGIYGISDLVTPVFKAFGYSSSTYTVSGSTYVPYAVAFAMPRSGSVLAALLLTDGSSSLLPADVFEMAPLNKEAAAVTTYLASGVALPERADPNDFIARIKEISAGANYEITGDYSLLSAETNKSIRQDTENEFMYFGAKHVKVTETTWWSAYFESVQVDGKKVFRPGGITFDVANSRGYTYRAKLGEDGLPAKDSYERKSSSYSSRKAHWYEDSSYSKTLLSNTFDKYLFRGVYATKEGNAMKLVPYTNAGYQAIQKICYFFCWYDYFNTTSGATIPTSAHPYLLLEDTGTAITMELHYVIPKGNDRLPQATEDTNVTISAQASNIGTTEIAGVEGLF